MDDKIATILLNLKKKNNKGKFLLKKLQEPEVFYLSVDIWLIN